MANLARVLLLSSIPVSLVAGPVTTTIDSGGIFCTPQHGTYSTGFVGGDGSTTATASAINADRTAPIPGNGRASDRHRARRRLG